MHPFVQSALGGILIGLASWLLLAGLGRIAGISGIAAGVLVPVRGDTGWRWAFVAGLVLGGAATALLLQIPPSASRPAWLLIMAGLLVGFGSVLGSGCTSGHGVCGLGRRSARSLVATLVFMGSGMLTVGAVTWLGH
ncbi:MAG: YeeE/YedE family protein [Polaromonas sp.]|nr:YeeE/YedE family protein [Polaromonas sp.]